MKKTILCSLVIAICCCHLSAQSYKFDFTSNKKTKEGYIKISPSDRYLEEKGYIVKDSKEGQKIERA